MPRVKRGTTANKKRKKVLKQTKGFRWGRSTKERQAKEALIKAMSYAFKGRKDKKRTMRRSWQVKIGAGLKEIGFSYSKFIGAMKKKNMEVDRKILATIAEERPDVFVKIVDEVGVESSKK